MRWVLTLLAATLPVLWPVSTWVQFRHNAGNNAVVRGTLSTSWQVQTDGPFSSSPSEAGGVVYIGNNTGSLYAIDGTTGRVLWTQHVKDALMTNPLVASGLVIVGEGNQTSYVDSGGLTKVGTGENAVIALDSKSGAVRWRVPLSGTAMPTPTLIGEVVVEHDGMGDVTGIDLKSGRVVYRAHIGGSASMVAMLPVGHDRFVTTSNTPNSVWEIDGRSGKVIWQHQFSQQVSGMSDCPPAGDVERQRVFCDYTTPLPGVPRARVGAPAVEHAFAIDARNGAVLWDVAYATGTLPQWNEASIPLVYRRQLYLGSSVEPQIQKFDPKTGRLLWKRAVKGVVKSGMCAKDGILYAGDYAGYLWAIDARSGAVIGSKNMHTVFNVGSPLIAGDTLIVGTNTGTIIALPLEQIRKSRD